jgi:proton-translocating NAD(P)+ transhydrogenase subunit alpha
MTRIAVLKETAPGEQRVAQVPDSVRKLIKLGLSVAIERGAGLAAGIEDAELAEAGAVIEPSAEATLAGAGVVLKVQQPSEREVQLLPPGCLLISFLTPWASAPLLGQLAARKVNAMAMERVPRSTRAQSVDALSSQATVAGYKAVLLGASLCPRLLPMLTTAAGTLTPSKVFVLGAGVAGLTAIATAKRLGAVVSAFDVRAAVKEQVQSLGARFVEVDGAGMQAQAAGGYAAELASDEQRRVREAIARELPEMDLVVTTAQIPGKRAPILISSEMVQSMKRGAVIVDLAADTGGNCELTRPGETVVSQGVSVLGPQNLAATVPLHASMMYARNLLTLLGLLVKDGVPALDLTDDITASMLVTLDGTVRL